MIQAQHVPVTAQHNMFNDHPQQNYKKQKQKMPAAPSTPYQICGI